MTNSTSLLTEAIALMKNVSNIEVLPFAFSKSLVTISLGVHTHLLWCDLTNNSN